MIFTVKDKNKIERKESTFKLIKDFVFENERFDEYSKICEERCEDVKENCEDKEYYVDRSLFVTSQIASDLEFIDERLKEEKNVEWFERDVRRVSEYLSERLIYANMLCKSLNKEEEFKHLTDQFDEGTYTKIIFDKLKNRL